MLFNQINYNYYNNLLSCMDLEICAYFFDFRLNVSTFNQERKRISMHSKLNKLLVCMGMRIENARIIPVKIDNCHTSWGIRIFLTRSKEIKSI